MACFSAHSPDRGGVAIPGGQDMAAPVSAHGRSPPIMTIRMGLVLLPKGSKLGGLPHAPIFVGRSPQQAY